MECNKTQPEQSSVINIIQGFGFKNEMVGTSNNQMTLEDVRSILNKSLDNRELYDYIRQDRDER